MRIGVDTGGTFTDFVLDDGRALSAFKLPSTPDAPERAIAQGCAGIDSFSICHGTTVGTNAILEGKLARTAFLSTFRDLPFLARQTRPALYDLEPILPAPPVLRDGCFSVGGRLDPSGAETEPLDLAGLPDVSGYEAVAVCLLFAYANPAHEIAVREALGHARVSLSHEVSPEFREYERACATLFNAGLSPLMSRYLGELRRSVPFASGRVMASAGGLVSFDEAEAMPLVTAVSGPAAGVVAVERLGRSLGRARLVGFDMGGTSTDVSLVAGSLPFTSVGDMAGLPVRLHRVDVHTIGCGGGSVAWLDAAGALRVGPMSAGAAPGPALYGRGGPVTVTDANYALGRLPTSRLGVAADPGACAAALEELAGRAGVSAGDLALAIAELAEAQMARAIRRVTSERGHDPADFALVSFGGAGGLHACAVADLLGMPEVLVPARPGVFSAEGLLASPEIAEASTTVLGREFALESGFGGLVDGALARVSAPDRTALTADLRYRGQSHEINVPVFAGEEKTAVQERFESAHLARYGVRLDGAAVEWVTLRVRLEVDPPKIGLYAEAAGEGDAVIGMTDGGAAIVARERLHLGERVDGAAVIAQSDATTFVPAGWSASVLPGGELSLARR